MIAGRRGLRGRFSFWVGPVAVSFLSDWRHSWYVGRGAEGGFVITDHGVRVQIGGAQPWRYPYTGPTIVRQG